MDQVYLLHNFANRFLDGNGDLPKLAFSLAMLNASSGLRSPHPMSSSAVFTFCIQPYSVLTGICSSSAAAFADPKFWLTWPPALCISRRILSSLTSSYPPFFLFFYFIPLWLVCQVLLCWVLKCVQCSLHTVWKLTQRGADWYIPPDTWLRERYCRCWDESSLQSRLQGRCNYDVGDSGLI